MALTEIYVDPSLASDTGAGTPGNPYGDVEWAIENETFDTVNGTRVNILAGSDEVLAASLETAMADTGITPAWVPTEAANCIFQGYSVAAGDGGIGGISGGGSVGIIGGAALDYVSFVDLHLHNCGAATVVDLDNSCAVIRCEVDNTTGSGVFLDVQGVISECYVHNIGATSTRLDGAGSIAMHNYIEGGVNDFQFGIVLTVGGCIAYRNIIITTSASSANGINVAQGCLAIQNSIYGAGAATGTGIEITSSQQGTAIMNNIIEGFSGTGGIGIDGTGAFASLFMGNAVQDCETDYNLPVSVDSADNEILTASPFTDADGGDFSPIDTGNVKEGSLPDDFGNGQ